MIITGDELENIAFVKARLSEQFLMSDLGSLHYFLGIKVSSSSNGFLFLKKSISMILLVLLLLLSAF